MMSSDKNKQSKNKPEEQLLNIKLGYLKVPQAVKDRFGTPTKYPNPDYRIGCDDDDTFELIFIFPRKDMEEKL